MRSGRPRRKKSRREAKEKERKGSQAKGAEKRLQEQITWSWSGGEATTLKRGPPPGHQPGEIVHGRASSEPICSMPMFTLIYVCIFTTVETPKLEHK